MPGVERCIDGITSALMCLVRDGFVCSTGGNGDVPMSCRPYFESVQRCLSGGMGTPDPVADAGAPDV